MSQRKFRPTASFWEAARIAVDSLGKSKLRSFLTLLGIILATSTLIAVMSFIHGMNVYIATKLSDMGSDGFRVVRIAFIGNWDPKKFLEMQRRNPQSSRRSTSSSADHAHLLKDIGMETWQERHGTTFAGETMQTASTFRALPRTCRRLSNIEVRYGPRRLPRWKYGGTHRWRLSAMTSADNFFDGRDPVGKPFRSTAFRMRSSAWRRRRAAFLANRKTSS